MLFDVLPRHAHLLEPVAASTPPSSSQELLTIVLRDFEEYSRRVDAQRAANTAKLGSQEEANAASLRQLEQDFAVEEEKLRNEVSSRRVPSQETKLDHRPVDVDIPANEGSRLVEFWKRKNQHIVQEVSNVKIRRESVASRLDAFKYQQTNSVGKTTRLIAQLHERVASAKYHCGQYRTLLANVSTAAEPAAKAVTPVAELSAGERELVQLEEASLKSCLVALSSEHEALQKLQSLEATREALLRKKIADFEHAASATHLVVDDALRLRALVKDLAEQAKYLTVRPSNAERHDELEMIASAEALRKEQEREEEEIERLIREKRVDMIRMLNRGSGSASNNVEHIRSQQSAELVRQHITMLEREKLSLLKDIDDLAARAKYDTLIMCKYR